MDTSTRYLGLDLPHPFMPGASPLVDDLDVVRRLEDAGAAAIVMHSLFEEQIVHEELAVSSFIDLPADSFVEARTYLPEPEGLALGPEEYLEHLGRVRGAVGIPVVASLNGVHGGRWLEYAEHIEEAGADALELNLYHLPTDVEQSSSALEEQMVAMVRDLDQRVELPLAIKLSPFYTSLPHFAARLVAAGADALVIFNRFYQADIDPEELDVVRSLELSRSSELLLRIRWLAILSGRLEAPLAVTGGVHSALDAVKAVMAGASAVQIVSALLQHGPERLAKIRREFELWLEEHEYDSLAQMRGSLNLRRCPDPEAFERANYMRVLQSWKG